MPSAPHARSPVPQLCYFPDFHPTLQYVGFIAAPGGSLDNGLIRLADEPGEEADFGAVEMNRAVLRAYCVCNLATFFLAFVTALYAVTHTMPRAYEDTARGVVAKITMCSLLLLATIFTGVATFLCGVFAVLPSEEYQSMWITAIFCGTMLIIALGYYIFRLWQLWSVVGWSGQVPPDSLPVQPKRDAQEVLLANLLSSNQRLLAEVEQLPKALLALKGKPRRRGVSKLHLRTANRRRQTAHPTQSTPT